MGADASMASGILAEFRYSPPPQMSDLVTASIDRLRPYQGGKPIEELAREKGLSDIVKLASNENPLGPSPRAVEAALSALANVHRYPDGVAHRLRSAIAEFHRVELAEVVHGNGSNELLELLVRTFTTPQHHVVFGTPGFSMYPVIAGAHGVPYTAVPTTTDLVHDLSAMLAALRPETRVLILDNPNNPTGTYVAEQPLVEFLRAVPASVIVVLDEAYFEFADQSDYPNGLRLRHEHERLVVLRTFSKAYGLAGFRVGYGIGPAKIMDYVNRLRAPFNVSVPSQEAGIAALADVAHLSLSVSNNRTERQFLTAGLAALARRVYPSQTNFVLADFDRPSIAIYEQLLDRGVIVRPIPGLSRCLRISVGTHAENQRFLTALAEVCG
jgi:histidinol-phosphate aminotransferase